MQDLPILLGLFGVVIVFVLHGEMIISRASPARCALLELLYQVQCVERQLHA